MDVFDLDGALVKDYERFARSFTKIRAEDIRPKVDALYASRRFWPEPLISINPHFERGASCPGSCARRDRSIPIRPEFFGSMDSRSRFTGIRRKRLQRRRLGRALSSRRAPVRQSPVLLHPDHRCRASVRGPQASHRALARSSSIR